MNKYPVNCDFHFFVFKRLNVEVLDIQRESIDYYVNNSRSTLTHYVENWNKLNNVLQDYLLYVENKDNLPSEEPISYFRNNSEEKIVEYRKNKLENSLEDAFSYYIFATCSVFFKHLWVFNSYPHGFQPLLFSEKYLSMIQELKFVQLNDFIEDPISVLESYPFTWELIGEKDPFGVQVLFMPKEQVEELYREVVDAKFELDEGLKIDHTYFRKLLKEARKEENDLVIFYYED